MPRKLAIKIVKVPLDPSLKIDKPAIFPNMNEMFLEYFENKAKLRKDYVNKGYRSNSDNASSKRSHSSKLSSRRGKSPDSVMDVESSIPSKKYKYKVVQNAELPKVQADASPGTGRYAGTPEINEELSRMVRQTEEGFSAEEDIHSDDDDVDMVNIKKLREHLNVDVDSDEETSEDDDDLSHKEADRIELEDRLNNMSDSESENSEFSDDDNMSDVSDASLSSSESRRSNKYSVQRNNRGYVPSESDMRENPRQRQREREMKPSPYESLRREEEKRELLFKFDLLRKSYPNSNITQDFSIKSDLETIKNSYEMNVRRLSLDSQVDSYKSYMIGGFMAVEYAMGHFLGFDMQGFTQQQLLQMNSYEKLLIEIGEKSYVPSGTSKFPVEVRLLFLVLMNAAIFIASKMIMAKTGANLLNMVNGMNSANFGSGSAQPGSRPSVPKRKMKGPSFTPGDI
jgi:hypothetical protein